MNNDSPEYGPSVLQMGNSLIEAELSQTIVSDAVALESFKTVLADKTKINSMIDLVEKSLLYFVPKNTEMVNYIWGVGEDQFKLIHQRLREVFKRSYEEYVPVFSFMSISISTTAELMHLFADELDKNPSFFKRKPKTNTQELKYEACHMERLALVLRGIYLKHNGLKQTDWIKVEEDLKYIKDADKYVRSKKKEFIEENSKNINLDGLIWLSRQFRKKYERQYTHFSDDFPLIAEAWTMGVVAVKQSELFPELTKLPVLVQRAVQRYAQLSNTLMGVRKIDLDLRSR